MTEPTERDPLIKNARLSQTAPVTRAQHKNGPLEISRSRRYGILAGIWSATFLSALNTTLVATLLPSISSDFNKSNQASWLGTSYLLAICTFTPLYGRLCNVMGRRGANQTAVILAGIGTLACGLSNSMEMLIVARFFAGLGGGGIFTTATIITSDMYSIRSRGLTQGVASVFNGLGMGLGGPVGGLISDWVGWRWAFLLQMPLFCVSLGLTQYNLRYATLGKSKSAKEVLKRIDYGGSFTLLISVGSFLVFLSTRYNEERPWKDAFVIVPLIFAGIFGIAFVLVELFIAPEPVLAPFLLKQKIPVLVGLSNYLVALCNFTVMYFFPTWFQTVALTSAATAGLHLMPNSVSMSFGSMFAGWMMHRTGRYKMINLIFGCFPFIGAILITFMKEDSAPTQLWLSIIPLGFGNAVVLQTMLIALLAHLPESSMAIGTGFSQLFRGLGQVSGVGISSAVFQSILDRELRKRIQTPDADQIIREIRHSARLVANLPPDIQRSARDSYAIGLKAVFTLAACSTFLAYIVRLPVPEKVLEHKPRRKRSSLAERNSVHRQNSAAGVSPSTENANGAGPSSVLPSPPPIFLESPDTNSPSGSDSDEDHAGAIAVTSPRPRRLSMFEDGDAVMDLEGDRIGGSARQRSTLGDSL